LVIPLAACGSAGADDDDVVVDAAVDAVSDVPDAPDAPMDAGDPLMPMTLEASGLWSDFAAETLAPGVHAFTPSYVLWSDSASKRRWVYLPPDSEIDTSDMNYWVYPVGTKLWKEFNRDGIRVETRLLYKTGEDAWFKIAYLWNADGTATAAAPSLGIQDALGTPHDVPSINDCDQCHDRMRDRSLGFTALQLDHDGADSSEMTLNALVDQGWLSDPPTFVGTGYFTIPGDAPTKQILGYLHANCGNCHHEQSSIFYVVDMSLKLDVTPLVDPAVTPQQTTTWITTVGVKNQLFVNGVTARIQPGDPEGSAIFARMSTRGGIGMPPVGTETLDQEAIDTLALWINSISDQP
jgi:hypothetical protein